jgi:hypothetical protein
MGNVSAASSSPSPGQIAQVPVDFNNVSSENAKALDTLRSWTATPSGKVELRFKQIDPATGLKVYEAKGGKSTVTIRATGFAEAAKQADRLVAAKALAPRSGIWSDMRADPKARFNLPKKSSFLGTSPGSPQRAPSKTPPTGETNTPRVASSSGKPTKEAKATLLPLTPKLISGSSLTPYPARNPLILGDGYTAKELAKFPSHLSPCPTDSTAAPQKTAKDPKAPKALPNPRSVATYTVVGAVASFNVNLSMGMPRAKALALVPAGAGRDVIQAVLAQLPLDFENPYLEVAAKGGVGGVVTVLSNLGAKAKYGATAYPDRHIHVGQVLAAFTVNGAIIGLKDLQKQGYLGGLPPDNPQGLKQWLHKYGGESAAIGLGVGSAMTTAVGGKELINLARGGKFDPKKILVTGVLATGIPTVQNLLGRSLTTSLCPAVPAETKNQFSLKTALTDALTYTVGSVMGKKVTSSPVTKLGTMLSFAEGLGVAVIAEQLTLVGTDYKIKQYKWDDLKKIDTAREALTDINTVLTHPGNFLMGAARTGGSEAYLEILKEYRETLYKEHPTLRPTSK